MLRVGDTDHDADALPDEQDIRVFTKINIIQRFPPLFHCHTVCGSSAAAFDFFPVLFFLHGL